jgi:UDP-N-acetylglucosamine transferase subunit ALG13
MTCFAYGKRPIVVPRLRRFGETSDDHQLAFARRLADAGMVTLVEEPEKLAEALVQAADPALKAVNGSGALVQDLREYLAFTVGGAPA